ncbi:acetyltransferase [Rhodoglobus sp. NPDC076762]
MTIPLVIVGAGGFGRETADVVEAINQQSSVPSFELLGIVDDAPSEKNLRLLQSRGVRYLGTQESLLSRAPEGQFIIGIGAPHIRENVARRLAAHRLEAATLIHPSATVGSAARIGTGSVVCAGVAISTNVALGSHVHLNANATIGHDSTLADYVSINPGAIISGDVSVESRTLIGAGAVVLQGLTVHESSIVGAAACVVRDVEQGCTVKGIPAR